MSEENLLQKGYYAFKNPSIHEPQSQNMHYLVGWKKAQQEVTQKLNSIFEEHSG